MKKNNLVPNSGLSLSQAQSVSNLCNQRAIEITRKLVSVNNYKKSVRIDQVNHVLTTGKPLPENVVELLLEKAGLHACQAFLMENIVAKDQMLKEVRSSCADLSSLETPQKPEFLHIEDKIKSKVDENFGWEQLTVAELNEYLEAEAYASHIGQFIHKDGILTGLRNELPEIPAIEWFVVEEGKKSPVTITVHHTSEKLLAIHEELSKSHREYEQRVNYFKAKVKNLTTEENARIAKHNADLQNEIAKQNKDLQATYETQLKKVNEEINCLQAEFEKTRQEKIKSIANMRIEVDKRFQSTVDIFLKQLPTEKTN